MNTIARNPLSKKLVAHIAGYSTLQFVGPAITLVLTPLYLRYLTIEEFASLSLLWLLGLLVANLGNLKLDQALRSFFFDFSQSQLPQRNRYFSQVFSVSFASALLLIAGFGWLAESLFGWLFGEAYAFAAPLAPMIIGIAVLNQFANTAFVWQQNQEQLTRYSLFKLLPLSLNFVMQLVAILVWDMGLSGIVMAHLLTSLILFLSVLTTYRQYLTHKISWREIAPSMRFSVPMLLFALLYYVDRNLDRVVVEKLLDSQHLAAFALWASLVGMVHLLLNALDTAIRPMLFTEFKKPQEGELACDTRFFNLYFALGFLAIVSLYPLIAGLILWSGKPEYQPILSVALLAVFSTLPLLLVRFFGLYYVFKKNTFSLTAWYCFKLLLSAVMLWYFTIYCQLSGTFGAIAVSQMLIVLCMMRQYPDFSASYLRSPAPLILLLVYIASTLVVSLLTNEVLTISLLSLTLSTVFFLVNLKHFIPAENAQVSESSTTQGEA